jgi:hypothetical protein
MSTTQSVEIGVCDLNGITSYSLARHFTTPVWINEAVKLTAMLDSGSSGNFISPIAVQKYG